MSDLLLSGAALSNAPCPVPSLGHRKEPSAGNLASYLRTVLQAYVIASSQGRSSQPPSRPTSPSSVRPADQPQAATPNNPLAKWNWQKSCRKAARLSKDPNTDAPCPGSSALLLKCEHWLEATDPKHRYGSHLRPYYTHWLEQQPEELDAPPCSEDFFEWLDEGPGRVMDLSTQGVSRSTLEASRVRYLSYEERGQYEVEVDAFGMLRYKSTGHVVHTHDDATTDDMDDACPARAPPSAPPRIRFAACQDPAPCAPAPAFRRACRRAASAPGDAIPASDGAASDSDPEPPLAANLPPPCGLIARAAGHRWPDSCHPDQREPAGGRERLPPSAACCGNPSAGIGPFQAPHAASPLPHHPRATIPAMHLPMCISDPFPALTSTTPPRTPLHSHQPPATPPAAVANPAAAVKVPLPRPHQGTTPPLLHRNAALGEPRTPPPRPQPQLHGPRTPSQPASSARDTQLAAALLLRAHPPHQGAATGKKEKCGWIYVMDITHRIYIHRKQRGLFHHSSFVCGAAVLAAGGLEVRHGLIEKLSAHSGHYRPDDSTFLAFVEFLKEQGADLRFTRILGVSGKKTAAADGHAALPLPQPHEQGQGQGQARRLPAAMRRDGEKRALLMRRNSF